MKRKILIQLMGGIKILADGENIPLQVGKHPKTTLLILNLILNRGNSIRNRRLMEAVWGEEQSANPESALKTLISRTRSALNRYQEGLGACVASMNGGYYWKNLPGVSVDLYEVEDLLSDLRDETCVSEDRDKIERLLELYNGDLLHGVVLWEEAQNLAVELHSRYMSVVHRYIRALEEEQDDDSLVRVCRRGLTVDVYDESLHLYLMRALNRMGRVNDALRQYQWAVDLYRRELGVKAPDSIREYYKQIIRTNQGMEENLMGIRTELDEYSRGEGAINCEYAVFRDIYKMQKRTQERYGNPVLLGLVMVAGPDRETVLPPARQEKVVQGLLDILRQNLRRGDVFTRLSPNLVGLLFPVSDYSDGDSIMKRVKDKFTQRFPDVNIRIRLQIGSLKSDDDDLDQMI